MGKRSRILHPQLLVVLLLLQHLFVMGCSEAIPTVTETLPSFTPSLSIANSSDFTSDSTPDLNLSYLNATEMYVSNTADCSGGPAWVPYATSVLNWPLAGTNSTQTVSVKFRDASMVESACIVDTIIHDSIAPSTVAIAIDAGAVYTTNATSTLDLSASDSNGIQMYVTNTAGCTSGGTWETFSATKSNWIFAGSNSTQNVYVNYRDAALNESGCVSASIIHDDTPPVVSLSSTPANPSNLSTLAINVGGTDVVNFKYKLGVNPVDCTAAAGYTTSYAEAINITDNLLSEADYTLCVVGQDPAGNWQPNSSATTHSWLRDVTPPTVTSVSTITANGTYTNGDTINFQINWSEDVTVTGTPQLTVETGTTDQAVNYTSGGGSSILDFDYLVGAADVNADLDYESTTALALNAGTITDSAGNTAVLTLAAPGAVGSVSQSSALNIVGTPAMLMISDGPTYDFGNVNINTGNPSKTFTLTNSGLVNATAMSGSGLSAPFTFTGGAYPGGSGTCGATLAPGATCTVEVTFDPTVTGLATDTLQVDFDNGITTVAETLDMQGTGILNPVVINVTSTTPNGVYGQGKYIYIQVVFDQAVTVTGSPYISLETGTIDRNAYYSWGSGSNTLEFYYYVQSTDYNDDLELVAGSSITVNGGTIKDFLNNNADLTLPSSGSNSLSFNKNFWVLTISATGVPENLTSSSALNVTVGNGGVTHYKYAIGPDTLDCSIASYSGPFSVAVPISDSYPVGTNRLCIIVRNGSGVWMSAAQAFEHAWVRESAISTVLPTMTMGDQGVFWGGSYSWAPDWSYMGWYSGTYEWTYLRFQLPMNIPSGAVVDSTYLTFAGSNAGTWNSSTNALSICAQNIANASLIDAADDYPGGPGGTTLTTCVRWPASGGLIWRTSGNNLTVNIASVIQELVTNHSGLSSGDYVQIWITAADPSTNAEIYYLLNPAPTLGISYH